MESGASAGRRFQAFGGLRAVAAGLVLSYHLAQATASSRYHPAAPFLFELKAGVTIFFVISGFLLYLPFARAIRSGSVLPGWRRFAGRRALRIVPAYWVALTVVALSPIPNDVLGGDWWRYYSFTQIYHRSTVFGGLGVAWTLCVEVSFYALLPVFAWGAAQLVRRSRTTHAARIQLALIGGLAFATLALRLSLTHSFTTPIAAHGFLLATSLPGLLDWFAIGLAFAVLASEWEADDRRFPRVRALAARPGGCWLLAACFYVVGAAKGGWPVDVFLPDYGLLTHLAIGIAAGLFVLPAIDPAPVARRSAPVRLLAHPAMAWLGTISYGIYLWHLQVLKALVWPFARAVTHPPSLAGAVGLAAATVAGAVVLGAASWYLVEVQAQRRLRGARLPGRRPLALVAPSEPALATLTSGRER